MNPDVIEAGARSAFQVDRQGRTVAAGVDREDIDQASLASLAAPDFDERPAGKALS
jgi:hypothetical protein